MTDNIIKNRLLYINRVFLHSLIENVKTENDKQFIKATKNTLIPEIYFYLN